MFSSQGKQRPREITMRTYAEYLNTMTVKTLNTIARDMGLKGYSKLRKAELITFIDGEILIDWDGAAQLKILNVEAPADHEAILKIMAEVLPIEFSALPAESVATALESTTPNTGTNDTEMPSLEDLKAAYRNMRTTVNGMRGGAARVRCVGRLRNLSVELRKAGIRNPAML